VRRRARPAKAKAKARLPVARKPRKSEASGRGRLEKRLAEVLEQQTATAEILRVISRSPTDAQPVFETIAASALHLCGAKLCTVFRFDGELIHLAALHHVSTEGLAAYREAYPAPPGRGGGTHRAILTRSIVHIPDIREDPEYELQALARANDFGCVLSVPMLRDGHPIGAITVGREAGRPFPDEQIELLKTFADQALIAIENVRLFKELEARNSDLTEALDQQTATAEILRVISTSPTDLQPVLDAVVKSAARFCGAYDATMFRLDGGRLRLAAHHGPIPIPAGRLVPVVQGSVSGRAVLERRAVHVTDVQAETEKFPEGSALARGEGWRTMLSVPLLREGAAMGTIVLRRTEVDPFTDKQIALLQTFADQAVIAIENVRLFNETQEALERQTATADILRVISSSPTDVQPVFDAIAESAFRLLSGAVAGVLRREGDGFRLMAMHSGDQTVGLPPSPDYVPIDPAANFPSRVFLGKTMLHIPDWTAIELPVHERGVYESMGIRSSLMLPLLREGDCVGVLFVGRASVRAYSDKEIALMQSFADQAVIAIENVRLFKEVEARTAALTRSVGELQALGEVGRAVSSTLDLQTVLTTIVSRAVQLSGLDGGVVFEYDEDTEEFVQRVATETGGALAEARRNARIRKGEGVLGQTATTLEPVQVPDITVPGAYAGRLRENLIESGVRAVLVVPMVREEQLIGCLGVTRNRPGDFPAETIELLRTFATQSALAIQNARLFQKIEEKSRELEAANRHKSEFLANMSHELRTPLNAIIGFSEVLGERMFGELNEKQDEYLKDIHASGTHLLSLINDILDLSKIEAGRMELELTDFDLPAAIDSAVTLVRERAARRGITMRTVVDERIGKVRGDERKIRQVTLNLLSNAIKFTPEGGRIEVGAVPADGSVEVSVRDSGVGIAPEDQEAVFEEFRQVGASAAKQEGTGLGLALCRKFVELHGGSIRVTSEVGSGSTFTFTIPVRGGD